MENKDLLNKYAIDYAKQEHPFLLFNLAGGDENAHTRILLNLLKFENKQFLPSFLKAVGLPQKKQVINLADQFPAIGLDGKGFGYIDLYLEYLSAGDPVPHKVIIENKINGDGDTQRQLERYIATVNGIIKDDLDNWAKKGYPISDGNHIHVLYLSDDGLRVPDKKKSLPEELSGKIDIIPVSYENVLLPWIKDQVLPSTPYSNQGIMIAGIRQYVASLEARYKKVKVSSVVKQFVNGLPGNTASKYEVIQKLIQDLSNEKNYPADVLRSLAAELKTAAEDLFATSLEPGWILHFTPSFFLLYKQDWAQIDAAKPKSYPSVHISGDTEAFLKGRISVLNLIIERNQTIQNIPGITYSRNTAKKKLLVINKVFDPNNPTKRANALNDIIVQLQNEIKIVDKFISSLAKNPVSAPNDKLVKLLA